MKLTKEEDHQIMLFEEYIETLVDRRIFHNQFPKSDQTFEDRAVAAARTTFLNEVLE